MSSPLENLQEDATAKLNSEEYFATISVASVRKLQIASEIAQKLPHLTVKGGKVGCGALVGMPTIEVVDPNAPGPQLMVRLPFRVHENPTINLGSTGTKKSAEEVAMQLLRTLHALAVEGVTILYGDKNAITPNTEFPGLVTYDVFLVGRFSQDGLSKVQTPDISSPAQTVTLTNNTPGATIYYTTDDSFPGAGNAVAQVYAAPFDVEAGTVVRWAAYKTGLIGSDVGRATIT